MQNMTVNPMSGYGRECRHYRQGGPDRIFLFCIWVTLFATFLEEIRLTSFMGLIILLGFLTYPAKKGSRRSIIFPGMTLSAWSWGQALSCTTPSLRSEIIQQGTRFQTYQIIAVIGVAALLEVTRRSVGWPILFVALFFILYAILYGSDQPGLCRETKVSGPQLFYTKMESFRRRSTCSKYIVVFIIFGAFLERTGISEFFINLANCAAGCYAGGPAKVAVISSALAVWSAALPLVILVTTGSVTIPMMKETGYKPEFAGAVEAAVRQGRSCPRSWAPPPSSWRTSWAFPIPRSWCAPSCPRSCTLQVSLSQVHLEKNTASLVFLKNACPDSDI